MTTMRVVGECFFWYRLTRVFPDKFHRAVKRLCVVVCGSQLAGLVYKLCRVMHIQKSQNKNNTTEINIKMKHTHTRDSEWQCH